MRKRQSIIICLACSLVVSIFSLSLTQVTAEDFKGKESKYIKLCSSSNLTSKQQKTCKEFNTYLLDKNQKLNQEAKQAKEDIKDTKATLADLEKKVKDIDQRIKDAQQEINYINKSVESLNKQVEEKNKLLEERLYIMQTSLNSNVFLSYLFNSTSLTDFFRRIMNINQITSYEQELMEDLKESIKEVEKQKSTLKLLQDSLKEDKINQVEMKDKYYDQLIKQNSVIKDNTAAVSKNQESIESIKDNLEAIQKASDESKVDNVTQAKPNKPQKPSKPNNNPSENEGNKPNDNEGNQPDNSENTDDSDLTDSEKLGLAIANKALTRQGYMYVWGGCHTMNEIKNPNQTQFDCSGLVCWAHYQCGVNIGVQSTKWNLATFGKSISKNDLQAGDIILFSSNGAFSGVHHVGIYIGDDKMVHAPSTGKPVQVANLNTNYWQSEWYTARRLY